MLVKPRVLLPVLLFILLFTLTNVTGQERQINFSSSDIVADIYLPYVVVIEEEVYTYIQWDLTAFPEGKEIRTAWLSLYEYDDTDDDDILIYLIDNQSVNLATDAVNTIDTMNKINRTLVQLNDGANLWQVINITNLTKQNFNDSSHKLLTIRLEDPDFNSNAATARDDTADLWVGTNNAIWSFFRSSSYATATQRPTLNITYLDVCPCPASGDFIISGSDNCNIDSNCVMDGISDFRCSGTGTVTLNANISGWQTFQYDTGCNMFCNVTGCMI